MAKQEEPTIKIPIGDWMQEYVKEEADVSTEDKIIELMTKEKMSAAQVARLVIIAREAGYAPDNIIPPNKPLLNAGGAMSIQSLLTQRYREASLPSGNTIMVREFVAPVAEETNGIEEETGQEATSQAPEEERGIVEVHSETASRRAADYLLKIVPGYIFGRLKIIAINGGNVEEAANELKQKIDELVTRLK